MDTQSKKKTFIAGIDLGTSNCSMSFYSDKQEKIEDLSIEQIHSPGYTIKKKNLPSCICLLQESDPIRNTSKLSWQDEDQDFHIIPGSWAKEKSCQTPEQVIQSAKSWLCNKSINRTEAILPWNSPLASSLKKSPVTSASILLNHLKNSFLHHIKEINADNLAPDQPVHYTITVPASFDEVARELTYQAAKEVGLEKTTLLEEPQAAFYSWISQNEKNWRDKVTAGDLILVCDVGGGTSDFSLIAVKEEQGNLGLERVGVGQHLLLGGDNMDLALAYHLAQKITAQGKTLDKRQFQSLVNSASLAKEKLFLEEKIDKVPISLAGNGSKLISSTIKVELLKEDLNKILTEGFFPITELDDLPLSQKTGGLKNFGLPYERDAAISKHLAKFLKDCRQNIESHPPLREMLRKQLEEQKDLCDSIIIPSAILFNGGVFKAPLLQKQILDLFSHWSKKPIKNLENKDLDLAVSRGATYFGKVKAEGKGIRIHAGTPRSYYLGIEKSALAVPGIKPEINGLCIIPQGTEEGTDISLPKEQFGLITGEKASFRFFTSTKRAQDQAGDFIPGAETSLEEENNLSLKLPSLAGNKPNDLIPVYLEANVTEVGTLKLSMKHTQTENNWNLEYNIRPDLSN